MNRSRQTLSPPAPGGLKTGANPHLPQHLPVHAREPPPSLREVAACSKLEPEKKDAPRDFQPDPTATPDPRRAMEPRPRLRSHNPLLVRPHGPDQPERRSAPPRRRWPPVSRSSDNKKGASSARRLSRYLSQGISERQFLGDYQCQDRVVA